MLPAFADPVLDCQRTFRAVLDATAHPGRGVDVDAALAAPPPLGAAAAAVALTLFDFDTPVWLDPGVEVEAREWLTFHTGAPIVDDPGRAAFALVVDPVRLPALDAFDRGTDERPERSTTLVMQVEVLESGGGRRLTGPGIVDAAHLVARGVPDSVWNALRENHALFPRGVDVIFTAGARLAAVPRTTRVED